MGIEINWHRKQIFPRDTAFPYQDFDMFFTAVVNEYKDRLANHPTNTPFNILALYHRINGLTQIVELFPAVDELFMLESFIREWDRQVYS